MKKIGITQDGKLVKDRHHSHLHEDVEEVIEEGLSLVNTNNRDFLTVEVDFQRTVGLNTRVRTTSQNEVVYARRPNRNGYTRFVKNREATPCSTLVIVLKKIDDHEFNYLLITSFIGTIGEVEPWDQRATQKSRDFWNTHALIWGSSGEIIPGTETDICPW